MAAGVMDGKNLSSVCHLGSELSCTTTQGDTLRGNVVAADDLMKVVVISILQKRLILSKVYTRGCLYVDIMGMSF